MGGINLGNYGRGEGIRFRLNLPAAPTGTPTITIVRGQNTALDTPISAVNMTEGVTNRNWYYDYTTEAAAQVDHYTVEYGYVEDGVSKIIHDNYNLTINTVDDIPTVEEINTELSGDHGATSWLTGGAGTGINEVTVRIQDQFSANQVGAKVAIYDSGNSSFLLSGTTDSAGEATFSLNDGTYYVRVSFAGFTFTSQSIAVTTDETFTLYGTTLVYSPSSDGSTCRLWLVPKKLDNTEPIEDEITVTAYSADEFAKTSGGHIISNEELTLTFNAGTTPDSMYIDLLRGANVKVTSPTKELNLDLSFTVPDQDTKDISDYLP